MTWDIAITFAILLLTIVLFIWDRIRMDLVALLAVLGLSFSGVISATEAVSGFGASIVVMIAALFVIGEGLFRTGIAAATGSWLLRVGGRNELRLLLLLMPTVAFISAFMSSTGAVALFIPVVLHLARKASLHPARLLMPLAFASLIGGMLTLVGTPPNIVVSGALEQSQGQGFGFFSFSPMGGIILFVGMIYMLTVGRWLLRRNCQSEVGDEGISLHQLASRYGVEDCLYRLKVRKLSVLCGQTVTEAGLRTHFEVTLFAIGRKGHLLSNLMPVLSNTRIEQGDELFVYGKLEDVEQLCDAMQLRNQGFPTRKREQVAQEFGVVEVAPRPDGDLQGKNLKEAKFRDQYNLSVIGIRRQSEVVDTRFGTTPIELGDTLLLCGGWQDIARLSKQHDLLVLDTPVEMQAAPARKKHAPIAIAALVLMLGMMLLTDLPSVTAVLAAAVLMLVSGCVRMDEAYQSLNATSLVLIAAMLPLAAAMESSGALGVIVDGLLQQMAGYEGVWVLAGLFLFTTLFSQFISNTATTVLVVPVAIATAQGLGLNPEPLLMTVAIAASTAFATPIASPVNTLVMSPGGYKFSDFVRVGVPLQLITLVLTLLFVPTLFPF